MRLQQTWTSDKGPKLKSEKKKWNAVEGFGTLEGHTSNARGRLKTPFPTSLACKVDPRCTPSGPKESPLAPPGRASSDRLVLTPAAAAPLSTAQAGAQRQVAAHAGHEERQGQQRQPAGAAQGVRVAPHGVIAGARLPELSLRVRHAVVEQALRAPHAGPLAEAVQGRVGGVSAAAPPVL